MMTQLEIATTIWRYLVNKGWSKEAVAGILGNKQSESGIIPDRWESDLQGNMSGGYGLVQWTPASKFINWANGNGYDYKSLDAQLKRIEWEVVNEQQWFHPNMSFKQFTQQTVSPEQSAILFITYYERPANSNQPIRQTQARYWYQTLKNIVTDNSDGNNEIMVPIGGISVGTNVWFQQGKLVAKSDQEPTVGPARGLDSAWVEKYLPGKSAPYLLKKNGQNIGYTTIDYIQRVSLLPINGIAEGSNVLCSKYGKTKQEAPTTIISTTSFWVAQYLDGNVRAPYRLLKNGKTMGYTTRENLSLIGKEEMEVATKVGEISVGTNVWFQEGKLTSSMEKEPSAEPPRGTNSAWVKGYYPNQKAPYLLMKNNVNIGYTTRANIQRVSQIPQDGILEGTNVICDKYSKTSGDYPAFVSNNTSYWIAQYLDGGHLSPYRLLKNGKTQGYTTRENMRVV